MSMKTFKVVQTMVFVFLAFIFSGYSTVADEYKNNTTQNSENKVFYIGGLFAIHDEKKLNGTSMCGPLRTGGFEEMNAMLFAMSKVNQDKDLLPGIKLRAHIVDTCSSMEIATNKSLEYTMINYKSMYKCFSNHSKQDKPVLAIVGERSSDISRAVTNLVGLFHIPVISYGATSPSLSGVKYFARTVASDIFVTQALIDVLERLNLNYITLLHSDDEYGRFAADSFRERLRKEKKNICTAVDEYINKDRTENLQTWLKIDKEKHKTNVVVVFATYDDFSNFLQAGKGKYNLDEYMWLSNDMWNGQTANLTCMLKQAISIIPGQTYIEEFAQFFQNAKKNLHSLKQYSYFDESWFEEYQSYIGSDGFNRSSATFNEDCVLWGSSEVSFVMDAVYTIAWALHRVLNCSVTTKSCDESEPKNFRKRLDLYTYESYK